MVVVLHQCGCINTSQAEHAVQAQAGGSDLWLVLTLPLADWAAWEWALRKARAFLCSSLRWTLLLWVSEINRSRISCSWRS